VSWEYNEGAQRNLCFPGARSLREFVCCLDKFFIVQKALEGRVLGRVSDWFPVASYGVLINDLIKELKSEISFLKAGC
jgi:hypothetical protein